MAHKIKSYHFDVCDSPAGTIGFCARINGQSKTQAEKRLQQLLPQELEIFRDQPSGEYITIYFNPSGVTSQDIDEIESPLDDRQLKNLAAASAAARNSGSKAR